MLTRSIGSNKMLPKGLLTAASCACLDKDQRVCNDNELESRQYSQKKEELSLFGFTDPPIMTELSFTFKKKNSDEAK